MPEIVKAYQTYAGTAAPFNFNGLVRHYYAAPAMPELGDVQLTLTSRPRKSGSAPATTIALELRQNAEGPGRSMPEGTSVKVVEPPPGPPVLATLLAEIYGP